MSRAPGRPRSFTGRQGLEGVTPDDAVCLEWGSWPDGFKGGVMGDSEESEEHESSLSLHEDISFSSISKERLELGDKEATEDSGVSARELAWRE